MAEEETTLRVGTLLFGPFYGTLDTPDYRDVRIEALGHDWVIVRDDAGIAHFYGGFPENLRQFTRPRPDED